MGVGSSMRLLGAAVTWRSTGLPGAGRALARALSGDEQQRTIAGMGLVQAGTRSVPVVEEEYRARGATTMMVRVLGDIGGDDARRVLAEIADGPADCADLARQLLEAERP